MAIKSYFFNAVAAPDGSVDREYNEEDFSQYLASVVRNGVFPLPSTNLQVMASSGMDVVVKSGESWIDGKKMKNTTDFTLTIDGSDVLYNRIDRVVFYLDYDERAMGIDVVKGELSLSPVAPALTRTSTRQEYCLATILIAAQASTISQQDITDTRADSTVCGWVAGLIQQVDTATLYAQWQAAYNEQYGTFLDETEEFMATLVGELRVNSYLQGLRFQAQGGTQYITVDYTNYDESDMIDVFINGLLAERGAAKDYTFAVDSATGKLKFTMVNYTHLTFTDVIQIRIIRTIIGISQLITSNNEVIIDNNNNAIITG